jgi:mxaJ protein
MIFLLLSSLSFAALRVCADPNDMPYSNQREEGFENRIAALVAHELLESVAYTWWPQRRGFVRETLKKDLCDVVIGMPADSDQVAVTRPYYRSSYVFVSRADRSLGVDSLDAPILKQLRVGIQLVGDDYANPPGATSLAARGIIDRVVGYSVYGDYAHDDPVAPIINAVVRGEVDVALVWGPQAGWFAKKSGVPMVLTPVTPDPDGPVPFTFAMAMGVRQGDEALRDRLQAILDRRRAAIGAILDDYGVPRR